MTDEQLVFSTLDEYAAAYCAKDTDRLMALFTDSDAISLIGTGDDELCSGREAVRAVFERNFRDATATRFEWGWKDVIVRDSAATVAIALNIHLKMDGAKIVVPIRWTVSLVKDDHGWKWVHRHASTAAGSQADGAAYPVGKN